GRGEGRALPAVVDRGVGPQRVARGRVGGPALQAPFVGQVDLDGHGVLLSPGPRSWRLPQAFLTYFFFFSFHSTPTLGRSPMMAESSSRATVTSSGLSKVNLRVLPLWAT